MIRTPLLTVAAAALVLSGCSTRPREFSAALAAPIAERETYRQTFADCRAMVRAGHSRDFKATAATALATGAGTVGSAMAMVGAGVVGPFTAGAGAVAATAALPVVGVLAGFGVSRAIRSGKERKYKRAMGTCLDEYGYTVASWDTVGKKQDPARIAADKARVAVPEAKLTAAAESAEVAASPPEAALASAAPMEPAH